MVCEVARIWWMLVPTTRGPDGIADDAEPSPRLTRSPDCRIRRVRIRKRLSSFTQLVDATSVATRGPAANREELEKPVAFFRIDTKSHPVSRCSLAAACAA